MGVKGPPIPLSWSTVLRVVFIVCFSLMSLRGQTLAEGLASLEAGRLEEATRTLSDFVRRNPESAEGHLYLGLAHFRSGRAAAARPLLERATRLSPQDAVAHRMLGIVITALGDVNGAVPVLAKACELDAADEEACYYLGRALHALARYDAAREPLEKALKSASAATLPRVHRAVALNFVALNAPADAERHFLQAIKLATASPRDGSDVRLDYGAFLFRQGRIEEATTVLQKAVRDVPASARANLEWGRVLLHMDKLAPAIECLEKAVKVEPSNAGAHLLLGRAYLRAGRTAEGEKELRLGQEGWSKRH